MADLANLVLAVDSTQVKTGTAALDGLSAAGARAEASTAGLGLGMKGAAAQGAAMAAAAQASARAAVDQAAGFKVATEAAQVNTLALRETLVVTRELMRGNYTRLPGSLMLLGQGAASQGGFSAYAGALLRTLGIVKQVQNAELAEAAAAAASATAGVAAAARRAGANVLAADTELALAEAQLRVAEGSTAEAAAQTRLALAHAGVAAAAAEAGIAENALGAAMARSTEASAASAAATRTMIGTTGAGLIGLGIAAIGVIGAFKALRATVDDTGVLDRYAQSITKTKEQLKDLEDKVGGFQITWGDVFHGLSKAASDALGASAIWEKFKEGNKNAFTDALKHAVDFAAQSYGVVRGSYQTIVDDWSKFPSIIGDAFYSAVNVAIGALNRLVKFGTDQLNSLIASANKLPFVNLGKVSASQIAPVDNPYAGADKSLGNDLSGNIGKFAGQARGQINANLSTIYNDIVGAAEDRIKDGLGKQHQKKPKKPNDHGLQEALDKLDAEIKGQYALAAAYGVSDAAVLKATALQKAEEDAISHKSSVGVFYEKELQKAVATRAAEAAKHLSDISFETNARTRLNAMIAAGVITTTQANEQLKLETTLRPINAALQVADAAHRQQILDIIKHTIDEQTKLNAQISLETALKTQASNDNEIAKLRLETQMIGASNKERAVAIAQLEAIQKLKDMPGLDPAARANFVQSEIDRATAGIRTPFQDWAASVPQTADAINQALQSIEFKGFDGLSSAITDVLTGTKNLKTAFSDLAKSVISEILQMTIRMLIFRAVSSIFGGSSFSTPSTTFAGVTLPGAANGGSMIIGGNSGVDNNVLSLNGRPVGMVSQGETLAVYPNRPAANSNGPQQIELTIHSAPSEEAWAKVEAVSVRVVGQAAPILVKAAASTTMKLASRPTLSGTR